MSDPNPPRPPGVRPWKGAVPSAMTAWAVEIINSPSAYPMSSETVRMFGDRFAMARVEVHTWSTRGQHGMGGDPNERIQGIFRGATLYEVVDPETYGTYVYNKQNLSVSGDIMGHHRYHYGANPASGGYVQKGTATVTGQAAGLINLAAKPVRWTFHTTGSLVKWLGGTLQGIGNKL